MRVLLLLIGVAMRVPIVSRVLSDALFHPLLFELSALPAGNREPIPDTTGRSKYSVQPAQALYLIEQVYTAIGLYPQRTHNLWGDSNPSNR